jgi:hypothetical protein
MGAPTTERSIVAMVISLLTGRALECAMAIWEKGEEELGSYEGFITLFRVVFNHPPEGREGDKRILQLRQDGQTTHLSDSGRIQRMECAGALQGIQKRIARIGPD